MFFNPKGPRQFKHARDVSARGYPKALEHSTLKPLNFETLEPYQPPPTYSTPPGLVSALNSLSLAVLSLFEGLCEPHKTRV